MSWIQRYALMVLLRGEVARVKDMCPVDVPANLFSYHLDGLVTGRYISKSQRGVYELTTKGLKLAGTFSTATGRQTENIKTVIMLYAKLDDRFLLFRWSRQPYLGKTTLLYDRVALGESLDDGIASALSDKLGDPTYPVTFMTASLIKIVHNNELISHMNALIYQVQLLHTFHHVSRNGEAFFGTANDVNMMTGVAESLDLLAKSPLPRDHIWQY
ncbi:MAG: hypothetical protein ACHQTE_00715 [Candidatus Saccharimonadales bacterium]